MPRSTRAGITGSALVVLLLAVGCSKATSPTDPTAHSATMSATMQESHAGGDSGNQGHLPASELTLELRPDVWSTEYSHSDGTIAAFVKGSGVTEIDLKTLQLSGDGTAAAISPVSTRLVRHQPMARFSKKDAIGLLAGAKPGQTHQVTLQVSAAGKSQQLSDSVRIVGPAVTP